MAVTLLSLLQGYNDLKMQDHYVQQHRFQKPAGGIMSRAGESLHGGVAGATTSALLQLHSYHARGAGGWTGGGRGNKKPGAPGPGCPPVSASAHTGPLSRVLSRGH